MSRALRAALTQLARCAPGAVALLLATACTQDLTQSTPLGPSQEAAESLSIVAAAADAPPVEAVVVSFYAKRGAKRDGRVYRTDGHGKRGKEYLRLTVDKNALLARPDGTPFANGDSVEITIRVVDPSLMLFQLEPAGLAFSPTSPAELRIWFDAANGDLDHSGHHDAQDDSIEGHLAIWRQPRIGDEFVRLTSDVGHSDKQVRTDIPGFSRYAIAY